MRRRSTALLPALMALGFAVPASGDDLEVGRFDAQVFRPSAAPRDLVMVQKSEVIGHLSPTVGIYSDLGFDPLVFIDNNTGQAVDAIAARLQLTGLAGVGVGDWADFKLAVPFVAWQSGANLRPVGTEGEVQSQSIGDMRVTGRLTVPYFNRRRSLSGLGMAIVGSINLPTGNERAFTSDGVLTGGAMLVTDYRFSRTIVTANAGVWLRPERQFAGKRLGDMGSVGVAAEGYVVQRWGVSVIGGVYGYPSLSKFPDSAREIPAETFLALRWQTHHGITLTFGGSFGSACDFGAPALRLFNGITWQPGFSREQEQIDRILEQNSHDPDGDGLTGDVDRCPEQPGPLANHGCPDSDRDEDGWVDREDECPDLPGGPNARNGCPPAFIRGNEIVILDRVYFETDRDIIKEESKPILEAVAQVLLDHPEIILVRIEGHTDIRASDAYNMNLSQRRVSSVLDYLVQQGVLRERLEAKGYGHSRPLYEDTDCDAPDEQLSADCLFRTSQNRRVVFRILRWKNTGDPGSPPPAAQPPSIAQPPAARPPGIEQ